MPILPKATVLNLEPYKRPAEGRYTFTRLDFNENTVGYPEACPVEMPSVWVNAYPEYEMLVERLANFFEVSANSLLLTNGGDEALQVISLTFIDSDQCRAVVSKPTYSVIPHCLKLAGARLQEIPVLVDLSFNVAGMESALKCGADLLMCDSPANPTGSVLNPALIKAWCLKYPDTLFVIDATYDDFAPTSIVSYVNELSNLLVVKSFSKAWGMAGLRLGTILGQPYLIDYLSRVRLPYSVNNAAVWTALRLLEQPGKISSYVQDTLARKEQFISTLRSQGLRVQAGHSNFFLLYLGASASAFTDFCRSKQILVRNRSVKETPLWGMVRVSIGTNEENDHFLSVLDLFLHRNESLALSTSPGVNEALFYDR